MINSPLRNAKRAVYNMYKTRGDGTRSTTTTSERRRRRKKRMHTHARALLNWRRGSEAKRAREPVRLPVRDPSLAEASGTV